MSFQDCPLACWLSSHFLVNFLLKASQAYFSLLYLSWALLTDILVVPAHFITLFFGLPRPIYYLFTSFTPMRFLLNLLGFLDPITTSLLLITTWAYWLLGQPIEFTNSFPRLSRPIYFLSISYYSHGLTISFLKLPWPTYSLFTSFYSCGAYWSLILPFWLIGLALLFSLLTFFILLGFFYCWAFCQK